MTEPTGNMTEEQRKELLDAESVELHKLQDRIHNFVTIARPWLSRSMRDDDYYHHLQWDKKDTERLRERGQQPSVDNRIAPKVNHTAGVRARFRMVPKALPRTPAHGQDAHVFNDVVSVLTDRTDYFDHEADAGEDFGRVGYGGYVFGTDVWTDPEYGERVGITLDGVRWNEFMWDQRSRDHDFGDATWMAIVKWRDYEEVLADPQYKGAEDSIKATKEGSQDVASEHPFAKDKTSWYSHKRDEIQVAEMYFRRPAENRRGWNWWTAHFTGGNWLLKPRKCRYTVEDDADTNWCPLVMGSAYVNRHGERYGLVRGLISLQDEINQRRSRLLFEESGQGFWYEESAIESPLETQQELLKANPAVRLNDGTMSDPEARPAFGFIDRSRNAEGQRYLLEDAKASIDRVGPTPNPAGQGSTLVTTPMAEMMMDGGFLELGPFFRRQKNLRKRAIERFWWMAKQYWKKQDYLRVLDERAEDGYRFLPINRLMTKFERVQEQIAMGVPPPQAVAAAMGAEGAEIMAQLVREVGAQAAQMAQAGAQPQGEPQAQQEAIVREALARLSQEPIANQIMTQNDIAKVSVDFTLDDVPYQPTAAHEEMIELLRYAREAGQPVPLKLLIKETNLRNKEEWLAELDRPPDPQQQQIQLQQLILGLQGQEATNKALLAQAGKWVADANAAGAKAAADTTRAQLNMAQAERVNSEIEENQAQAQRYRAEAVETAVSAAQQPQE